MYKSPSDDVVFDLREGLAVGLVRDEVLWMALQGGARIVDK